MRGVAEVIVLAFTRIKIVETKTLPSLLTMFEPGTRTGISWHATSKHIPFAFLFGSGTSDGCAHFLNRDSNDARALPAQVNIVGGQYNNSVQNCCEACSDAGYGVAAMEYARECCTCRLFDELSSPDQTSLSKGVPHVQVMSVAPRR